MDAFGDDGNFELGELGAEHKVKLENRLRILQEGNIRRISGTAKAKAKFEKYHSKSEVLEYPAAADSTLQSGKRRHSEIEDKKPLIEEICEETSEKPQKKKRKTENGFEVPQDEKVEGEDDKKKKKKKRKKDVDEGEAEAEVKVEEPEQEETPKKKKKKKRDVEEDHTEVLEEVEGGGEEAPKKKKKKKKIKQEPEEES